MQHVLFYNPAEHTKNYLQPSYLITNLQLLQRFLVISLYNTKSYRNSPQRCPFSFSKSNSPETGLCDSSPSCFYASPGSTSALVSCLSLLFFPVHSGKCRGHPSASSWGRISWSWRPQCPAAGLHLDSNTWTGHPIKEYGNVWIH